MEDLHDKDGRILMRRSFGKTDLDDAFRSVGRHVQQPVTCYLIGGGAMTFRERKAATKDLDIVLAATEDMETVLTAMEAAGLTRLDNLQEDYRRLGTRVIFENERGLRFDIYEKVVAEKLALSERMIARSEKYEEFGGLAVRLASPEDIFLFKSVADRPEDIDDMSILASGGLQWPAIRDEIFAQESRGNWAAFLATKLEELEEKYDIRAPIIDEIRERAEARAFYEVLAPALTEGALSRAEIVRLLGEKYDFGPEEVDRELERQITHGLLRRERQGSSHRYSLTAQEAY